MFSTTLAGTTWRFPDLRTLLARATPLRSGDVLAGVAAADATERVAAQLALADVPLAHFLTEVVVPYESDAVTRLLIDTHDRTAFAAVSHLTVGGLRDWLLSDAANTDFLAALAPGLLPEMAAAVSKLCRNQDLIVIARKCQVITAFRNTIGQPGRFSSRLQPNHPTDDLAGILASIVDGLLLGSGDAVIGINPASDSPQRCRDLVSMLNAIIEELAIPTQSCVLTHLSTTLDLVARSAPVDLVFQSIGGTEGTNTNFGVTIDMLREGLDAGRSLKRGNVGDNVMYFETGQGSALSAGAHAGCDQQTIEARAYGLARQFEPLLVNSVVGFIGPEYLYDGKQILRAGLEDHFCGKLLGLPMGCDVCYTNHAEADGDDMDVLLNALVAAGVTFVMGVPGADDVMLNYQSTSFHDVAAVRKLFGFQPAPEFEVWQQTFKADYPRGAGSAEALMTRLLRATA